MTIYECIGVEQDSFLVSLVWNISDPILQELTGSVYLESTIIVSEGNIVSRGKQQWICLIIPNGGTDN